MPLPPGGRRLTHRLHAGDHRPYPDKRMHPNALTVSIVPHRPVFKLSETSVQIAVIGVQIAETAVQIEVKSAFSLERYTHFR